MDYDDVFLDRESTCAVMVASAFGAAVLLVPFAVGVVVGLMFR